MIEVYTCCRCKNEFDEFEMNDRAHSIDGDVMCNRCRHILGVTYPSREERFIKIYTTDGKIQKDKVCCLCWELIPKGSKGVQFIVSRGKRQYMHADCPTDRQGRLEIE